MTAKKVYVIGASGKPGRYMVQHSLDRGHEVGAVCRAKSVGKLSEFDDRVTLVPEATNDRGVIKRAVAGCDEVLVGLARSGSGATRQDGVPSERSPPRGRPGAFERESQRGPLLTSRTYSTTQSAD